MMHFKYSSIIVQVYVSFMYGMCIPLLFPIALFGIFNMYFVERLSLAYYFKRPPMYDEKLNENALFILKHAPLLMFLFGYWGFGNRQIFFNEAPDRLYVNTIVDPEHELFDYSKGPNQTMMILFVLWVLLMIYFFHFVTCFCTFCCR